jgi:pilus assembly protein Flp/PilA
VAQPLRFVVSSRGRALTRDRNFDKRDCAFEQRAEEAMQYLTTKFRALLRNDEGQDLIEYALIAGLVALVAVVAIQAAGVEVDRVWDNITTELKKVP